MLFYKALCVVVKQYSEYEKSGSSFKKKGSLKRLPFFFDC
jgi:hypothetical protein